ncbi:MAG TPA: signal peptidase I [Steroidobacteraceae bacterium]|nr:signal peptidase I [Steroidobacteraceae bacterium]
MPPTSALFGLVSVLSWFAIPVALACVVDDWFLRPGRQIAAAPEPCRDPPVMSVAYYALPVLVAAAVIRLLWAEKLDFSLVLVLIAVVTGLAWLLDAAVLRGGRAAAARRAGKDVSVVSEPGTVDYARSFFPVAVIVLLLRAFVFEPFRIPSDSMMPTLIDGDFIIVNKYVYGLRWPVLDSKFLSVGEPQRGDVVVFRYPLDPSINYIKRVVGLPGDRVSVHDDLVTLNGKPVPVVDRGLYDDGCYEGMHLLSETLGHHTHEIMYCPATGDIAVEPLPTCTRNLPRGYVCPASNDLALQDHGDWAEHVIPPGMYLMLGDNRDNSADGRYFGFVPEANLVGKATRIWFNWAGWRHPGGPIGWGRIGMRIR